MVVSHHLPKVILAEPPLIIDDHHLVIDQADHVEIVERAKLLAKVRVNVTRPLNLAHELTQCENSQVARQMPPESVMHYEPQYNVTSEALTSSKAVTPSRSSVFSAARTETETIQAQETKYLPPVDTVRVDTIQAKIQSPRARSQPVSSSVTYAYESTTRLPDDMTFFERETLTETISTEQLDKLDSRQQPTRPVRLSLPAVSAETNVTILPPKQFQTPEVITESLVASLATRTVLETPASVSEPLKLSQPALNRLDNELLSTETIRVDSCDNIQKLAERVEFEPDFTFATEHTRRVSAMPCSAEIDMQHEASALESETFEDIKRVDEARQREMDIEEPCEWHRQTVYSLAKSERGESEKAHAFFVDDCEQQREEICMTQEIVSLGSSVREVCLQFFFFFFFFFFFG